MFQCFAWPAAGRSGWQWSILWFLLRELSLGCRDKLHHTCCLIQFLSTLNAPQPTNMLVSFKITVHEPSLVTSHPFFWHTPRNFACYPMAAFLSDCFTRSYPIVPWKKTCLFDQQLNFGPWTHGVIDIYHWYLFLYIYIYMVDACISR